MKSLVVYYSHSGHTANVAYKFLEVLREKGPADIFELKYRGRRRSLLLQLLYRLIPLRVKLSTAAPLDVEEYDLVCIGIPVWGGQPAPPVSAYIKGCKNTGAKKIICFLLYEVEASAGKCLDYIKEILDKKGRSDIISMSIYWRDAGDDEVIARRIKETLDRL